MPKMIVYKTDHKQPGLKFPHPDQIGSPGANCAELFNVKSKTSQITHTTDIPRTNVLASAARQSELVKRWKTFNKQKKPFYSQGLMTGSHFLSLAYYTPINFQKIMKQEAPIQEVSFAFLDDHSKTCGFSIVFDPNKHSEWAASVYRDADKENLEDREVYFITHEGNKEAKDLFKNLESQPTAINNLKELINCKELNPFLGNLIKENNEINLIAFRQIESSIEIGLHKEKSCTNITPALFLEKEFNQLTVKIEELTSNLSDSFQESQSIDIRKILAEYKLEIINAINNYQSYKNKEKLEETVSEAGKSLLKKVNNIPNVSNEDIKKSSSFLSVIRSLIEKFFNLPQNNEGKLQLGASQTANLLGAKASYTPRLFSKKEREQFEEGIVKQITQSVMLKI